MSELMCADMVVMRSVCVSVCVCVCVCVFMSLVMHLVMSGTKLFMMQVTERDKMCVDVW